jgi:hypothetical protein
MAVLPDGSADLFSMVLLQEDEPDVDVLTRDSNVRRSWRRLIMRQ